MFGLFKPKKTSDIKKFHEGVSFFNDLLVELVKVCPIKKFRYLSFIAFPLYRQFSSIFNIGEKYFKDSFWLGMRSLSGHTPIHQVEYLEALDMACKCLLDPRYNPTKIEADFMRIGRDLLNSEHAFQEAIFKISFDDQEQV